MRGWMGVLAAVVLVTAGCGGRPDDTAGGAPEIGVRWTSCEVDAPEPVETGEDTADLPPLGTEFVPVSAAVCTHRNQTRADGGEDLVEVESRADDIAALVAAVRLPVQQRTAEACTLELPGVAFFVLLDARGRWVRPGLPTDECGKIRIEVRDAVRALALTPVSTRKIRELVSSGAAAAGCSQGWADMVAVETSDKGRTWADTSVSPLAVAPQVRLCVYRVPPGEQGSGKPAGDFVHGGLLAPARWASIDAALKAALKSAGKARECATPADRFALLRRSDGLHGEVYVELDGCRRILMMPVDGRPALSQGDAALAALLDQR